jgi:hypothetical protein
MLDLDAGLGGEALGFLGQQVAERIGEIIEDQLAAALALRRGSQQRDEIGAVEGFQIDLGLDVELARAQGLDGSGMTNRQGGRDRQHGGNQGKVSPHRILRGKGAAAAASSGR